MITALGRPLGISAALDPVVFSRLAGIDPDPWQADLLRSTAPRTAPAAAPRTAFATVCLTTFAADARVPFAPRLAFALALPTFFTAFVFVRLVEPVFFGFFARFELGAIRDLRRLCLPVLCNAARNFVSGCVLVTRRSPSSPRAIISAPTIVLSVTFARRRVSGSSSSSSCCNRPR